MTDLVAIKMTTNLLHRSRMNGFILPEIDGVVEVDPDSAERLVDAEQAEFVEPETDTDEGGDESPAPEPEAPVVGEPETENQVETTDEGPAKRGPGRPRKNP